MQIPDLSMLSGMEAPMMGTRYLSAAALSILFYDRCIHFDEEVADVWSNLREKTWLKLMFLLGRFTTEVFVIYTTVALGGFNLHLTQKDCETFIIIAALLVQISAIGTEGVVIYRLRSLWDQSRQAACAISLMASFMLVLAVVATILFLFEYPGLVVVGDFLENHQCLIVVPRRTLVPALVLEATVLIIWDIFNVLVFATNTFATPYQCSSDVFSRFKRDGGRYFICLLAVRSLHFFMAILGRGAQFSIITLAWVLAAIINARIFHRIGRDFETRSKMNGPGWRGIHLS